MPPGKGKGKPNKDGANSEKPKKGCFSVKVNYNLIISYSIWYVV